MASPTIYRNHGIHLTIPEGWEVEEQSNHENDLTITVSDGAAFWTLTLMWERPQVERVLLEAKQAFQEEYQELDAEEVHEKISRRDSQGVDMQFVCMELINHVSLRAFRTGRFTAFMMWQMTDHERRYYDPLFKELIDSLDVDQDGEILIG